MWPDWESNWQPFGLEASTQPTEPDQPGLVLLFWNWFLYIVRKRDKYIILSNPINVVRNQDFSARSYKYKVKIKCIILNLNWKLNAKKKCNWGPGASLLALMQLAPSVRSEAASSEALGSGGWKQTSPPCWWCCTRPAPVQFSQITRTQVIQAKFFSANMCFWTLWHFWPDSDAVLGHFLYADPSWWWRLKV